MARQIHMLLQFSVCALMLALVFAHLVSATVRIDPSFGEDGAARPHLGPTYAETAFTSISPQPDGAILAATGFEGSKWLHRFLADGTPDADFTSKSIPTRVTAELADGKVLIAEGESGSLERLEVDGTSDSTYGTRSFGQSSRSDLVGFRIETIVPLPSGSTLVAGTKFHWVMGGYPEEPVQAIEQLCIARLDGSGALDRSFNDDGVAELRTGLQLDGNYLVGIAPSSNGGVIAIATDTPEPRDGSGSSMVALTGNGHLDWRFGDGGYLRLAATVTNLEMTADNRLLVAGIQWRQDGDSDPFVARYDPAGLPDSNFGGGDGIASVDFGGRDLTGSWLIGDDGSILLGGSSIALTDDCVETAWQCTVIPVAAKFSDAGALDPRFGDEGVLKLDALAERTAGPWRRREGILALAFRPGENEILAAGGSGPLAFIVALQPTGELDRAFGQAGIVTWTEPRASNASAAAVAVDGHSRIVVAGRTNADQLSGAPDAAVLRFTPNGRLDTSFGGGSGYARIPAYASSVALTPENKVLALSPYQGIVSRLTADGRIDRSFGAAGIASLPGKTKWRSMAVSPTGAVLVVGEARGADRGQRLLRLWPNGAVDTRFGKHWRTARACKRGYGCGLEAIAMQRNGRTVLVGWSRRRKHKWLTAMRIMPDGSLDRSFGHRGRVVRQIGAHSYATAVSVRRNGEIIVGGRQRAHSGVRLMLLRFRSNGQLDHRFGHRGISYFPVPRHVRGRLSSASPQRILTLADRYLVLQGGPGTGFTAVRRSGHIDRSFGKNLVAANGSPLSTRTAAVQRGTLIVARSTRRLFDLVRLTGR